MSARSMAENGITLFLALSLAIFIWANATKTEDPVRTRFLEIPVETVGLPAGSLLEGVDARQTVQIRLEGPDSILREMIPEDFAAILDVSQVIPGAPTNVAIAVTGEQQGATISFITPEELEVLLEEQVSKQIPVELDLRGSVARGHSQGEPLVEPPFIVVSGPAGQVNALDFALATVFLNSSLETTTEMAQPIFYDQGGRVVSMGDLVVDSDEVSVTIPVEESAGFAEKLVNVNWTGEPAPGYRLLSVSADPPTVLIEGRPAQLNSLFRLRTEPIDITGLTETFQQTAVLDLPSGLTIDPEQTVTVVIEIEPILTTGTYNRTPEVQGLEETMEALLRPEQVRVVVFGPLPVLDSLADEDVRVTLDVFGLKPGTYSMIPAVDIPDRGLSVRSVQPTAVLVTITPTITITEPITATLEPTGTSINLNNSLGGEVSANADAASGAGSAAPGVLIAAVPLVSKRQSRAKPQ